MWWVNAWFDEMAALFITCIVLVILVSFSLGFFCGKYVAGHNFQLRTPITTTEVPKK